MKRGLALLVAVMAFVSDRTTVMGHPNAACKVSAHTTLAATDNTVEYLNPQVAGNGLDAFVVYDTEDSTALVATYGYPNEVEYSVSGGYWEMDVHFVNGTVEVAPVAEKGTARVAVNTAGSLLVVYAETTTTVTSKLVTNQTKVVGAKVDVSTSLTPVSSFLVADKSGSGFYYGAVAGGQLNVFKANVSPALAWTALTTSSLAAASTSVAESAAAIDVSGTLLVAYHDATGGLALAKYRSGVFATVATPDDLTGGGPFAGVALAAHSTQGSTFMLLVNNNGVISSFVTTDVGATWAAAALVEPATEVRADTKVGLVHTNYKWVPVWAATSGSTQYRAVNGSIFPATADWASVAKGSFFTGSTATSKLYSNPVIARTGGDDGWMIAASDSLTSDVSFRACFDAAAAPTPAPSSSPAVAQPPTSASSALAFSSSVLGMVLFALFLLV